MPRPRRFLPGLALLLLSGLPLAPRTAAQTVEPSDPDVRFTLGGTLQPRFSYGRSELAGDERVERLGFGMRRMRLRFQASLDERVGAFVQLEGGGGDVGAVDVYAFYQPTERLRFRLGRFVGAQPRAFILTPHALIDAVDRAAIAELWGRRTLSPDGRDFGLDVRLDGARGHATLFLHNGDGNWSAAFGNFREGISGGTATGSVQRTGMAVSLYGAYEPEAVPGLEVGGFAGYNGAEGAASAAGGPNPNAGRTYASYAAHLYWGAVPGSRPVRLKADLIGVRYASVAGVQETTLGLSLLGAVRAGRAAEVFGRAESYRTSIDREGGNDVSTNQPYWTVGASISPSALFGGLYRRERLTLAYSTTRPDPERPGAGRQHLVILQAQLIF